MYINILKFILITIFLTVATITDYKEYKIKNKTIVLFLLTGIIINFVTGGVLGLSDSIYGLLIPLVLFPLFALKMLGAGDVKAFCAIGSIIGFKLCVYTILFSFLSGGIIAIGFMLFRKNAVYRFGQFFKYFKQCFYMQKLLPYEQFKDEKSNFRFSLGLYFGFLLMVLNYYHIISFL